MKAVLRKVQKEMKQQVDKERKAKEWKKGNMIMLSTKDLVFKERPVKKFVKIEECGLSFSSFSFSFYFLFNLFSFFYFQNSRARVRSDQSYLMV